MEESHGGSFTEPDTSYYGAEQRIPSKQCGEQGQSPWEAQYFLVLLKAAE